jgi:hypothetical protein
MNCLQSAYPAAAPNAGIARDNRRLACEDRKQPPDRNTHMLFTRRLADLGCVEGHSIAIEWRRDRGSTEQFPRYAAEVAGSAAKNATKTIPIVIATMEDPVQQGFSTSLAHPGGGITGLNLQTPACRAQACLSYQNCLLRSGRLFLSGHAKQAKLPDLRGQLRCASVSMGL